MSLHKEKVGEYELVWGYEESCGYYFLVYDKNDDVVEERDSILDKIGREDIVELAASYGIDKFVVEATLEEI